MYMSKLKLKEGLNSKDIKNNTLIDTLLLFKWIFGA